MLGLGEGLFYNALMPATVVILRSTKRAERAGKVLFINAVHEFGRERAQSFLRESHQEKIVGTYRAFEHQDGFAAVATSGEISENGYSLAIPLYVADVRSARTDEQITVSAALAEWRVAANEADTAVADVLAMLRTEVPA